MDWPPVARIVGAAVVVLSDAGCSCNGTDLCTTADTGSVGDFWCPITLDNAPANGGLLLWTGTEVLAMRAGRYDPVADTWESMSENGAPVFPVGYGWRPVWTGSDAIVPSYVGVTGTVEVGSRYDPIADAWSPLSAVGAPSWGPATSVWTGTEVIVLGCQPAANGFSDLSGSRYNPAMDSWTAMSSAGAPGQTTGSAMTCGRVTAVWSGSEAIVVNCANIEDGSLQGQLGDMGHYDPATDSWTVSLLEPYAVGPNTCPYFGYTSVWSGTDMILWGRLPMAYDPVTRTTRAISTAGAPEATYEMADPFSCPAIWSGSLMLVWGSGCDPASGGRYDPVADTWTPIASAGAPPPTNTIVWAGTQMVVWGGPGYGGRYTP